MTSGHHAFSTTLTDATIDGLVASIKGRYDAVLHEVKKRRDRAKRELQERHRIQEGRADQLRQHRATEREQQTESFEQRLRQVEQMRKKQERDRSRGLER